MDNTHEVNPFQELYVTDSPDPDVYVRLFSDVPVKQALKLFEPGNIVLKGIQGAGKSMLLNLFRPDIRLAYFKAGVRFPVPKSHSAFLGAGINLTRSGILDIGQRPIQKSLEKDLQTFPLYFADFLNYWVVRDILRSVDEMRRNPDAFDRFVREASCDEFAGHLATEDCWFGWLKGCNTFAKLAERLDERIIAYREFHNFNSDMDDSLKDSKTTIGEPIARAAEILKKTRVIPQTASVFVRIDQLERLHRSDALRAGLGAKYRQIINKAVGLRDSRISYRMGTRRYAWEDDLIIYGSRDRLERIRDYRIVDLEEMLRRKENTKEWIFPKFAEDVLCRRLRKRGYDAAKPKDLMRRVFGKGIHAKQAARQYALNSNPRRVLKLQGKWHPSWKQYLYGLFQDNPLEAVLASAWARQTGSVKGQTKRQTQPPPSDSPWRREYWKKERIRQALMQIAARTAQRLRWSGADSIIRLSSANVTIFLSICHEIWDAFLRTTRGRKLRDEDSPLNGIEPDIQAVGIHTASQFWHDKMSEQAKGDQRQRFVDHIASFFRSSLLADHPMSYPGHNGFSLTIEQLDQTAELRRFLCDAVDYGDLVDVPHTTKEKDRRPRRKWYVNPILSAFYQIPEIHAKEPYYANLGDVSKWLSKAEVRIKLPAIRQPKAKRKKRHEDPHPTLF